jgi:hypothetical protein
LINLLSQLGSLIFYNVVLLGQVLLKLANKIDFVLVQVVNIGSHLQHFLSHRINFLILNKPLSLIK